MSTSNTSRTLLLSPGAHANSSTGAWGFEPFPSNLTFVNGTLKNGTVINGNVYNGSVINGTTIILTLGTSAIGSIQLSSFVYLIMSCIIVILMLCSTLSLIRASTGDTVREHSVPQPTYSERMLQKDLQICYPKAPQITPQRSYPELADSMPNDRSSTKELEWCKRLLRGKYSLDCQIVNLRHVYAPNRHIVDGMKARSEGAVQDLRGINNAWISARDQWSEEEWALVTQISMRISAIENRTERNER